MFLVISGFEVFCWVLVFLCRVWRRGGFGVNVGFLFIG